MFSHIVILLLIIFLMNTYYFYVYHLPQMITNYRKSVKILDNDISINSEESIDSEENEYLPEPEPETFKDFAYYTQYFQSNRNIF